jgi:hypothetical protein
MGIEYEAAIDWIKAERRPLRHFTQTDRLSKRMREPKVPSRGGNGTLASGGVTRPSFQALAAGSKRRTGCTG